MHLEVRPPRISILPVQLRRLDYAGVRKWRPSLPWTASLRGERRLEWPRQGYGRSVWKIKDPPWRYLIHDATDPLGDQTSYTYDAAGNLTQTKDAIGSITQMGFDAKWNPTSLTDANGHQTQWLYDAMDRVARRTDPLQGAENSTFDLNGNLATFTDRKQQITVVSSPQVQV